MKGGFSARALAALARERSPLTAVQAELLRRVGRALPFCADILGAQLTLYLPALDEGRFVVAASLLPHTAAFSQEATFPEAASTVAAAEEPLVAAAFCLGGLQRGKREVGFGESLLMFAFAVADGAEPLAVVALVLDGEGLAPTALDHLLETAMDVVRQAKKPLAEDFFPSFAPGTAILIADRFRRIVFANAAALHLYRMLGVAGLVGVQLFDRRLSAQVTRESVRMGRPAEKEVEAGGRTLLVREVKLVEGGDEVRRIRLVEDVTELREKEREIRVQSAIIQEIHHRVKNSLQTVASLLRMQARRSGSDEVRAALKESVSRILAIAGAHEVLSANGAESFAVQATARNVLALVRRTVLAEGFSLVETIEGEEVALPAARAANLALVMNEIFQNALEHGFKGRKSGAIGLRTSRQAGHVRLDFHDDGCGMDESFAPKERKRLGFSIMRTIVEGELGGILRIESRQDAAAHGTHVIVDIPWEGEL